MGNVCINVKGHRTATGACGPYNLGGSATVVPTKKRVKKVVVLATKYIYSVHIELAPSTSSSVVPLFLYFFLDLSQKMEVFRKDCVCSFFKKVSNPK